MNRKLQKLTLKLKCSKPGMARTTFWFVPSFHVTDSCVTFSGGRFKRKRRKRLWQPR